jgi:hypothetical protein
LGGTFSKEGIAWDIYMFYDGITIGKKNSLRLPITFIN